MPELPDVEELRRFVESRALHCSIQSVKVWAPEMLHKVSARELCSTVTGEQLKRTCRHGKFLFMGLSNTYWLILHFGMTGNLILYGRTETTPPYTRFQINFQNGWQLAYTSRRKLGMIGLAKNPSRFVHQKNLGPDALSSKLNVLFFQNQFRNKKTSLKAALMNQHLIAGIGNIYSDEILYQAGLHPMKSISQLNEHALKKLTKTIQHVLQTAIDRRADPENFPRSWMLPSRFPGGSCPKCGQRWGQTKVSGRTAYFCSICQPREQ